MAIDPSQVVITGAGLATPLGLSVEHTWQSVLRGQCGIRPLTAIESPLPPGADGGQAPDLPEGFAPGLPRESRYLRYALLEALRNVGIEGRFPYRADRCGIILGTTLHGMRSGGQSLRNDDDFRPLKDFLAAGVLRNATAGLAFGGCAATTCSACSSSLVSIAMAAALLRSGQLDLVVAGGYDTLSEYVYGGFNSLRLVAAGPLRPFTRQRQGMKLSEGYGIVVLERAEDARGRGRSALATILGCGESADAHHLTQPHPQGAGAARAIRQALASAAREPADIDLVAAHATGTPDNDAGEYAALASVFGPRLPSVPVVAFKSHLGHTLGGAGAVELILSAMAMRDQVIPACANVDTQDVEFANLNVSTGKPREARIRATLNTSLGFGGSNACVVLGPAMLNVAQPPSAVFNRSSKSFPPDGGNTAGGGGATLGTSKLGRPTREVLLTGIGVVFPGAIGNEQFIRRLAEPADRLTRDTGAVAESDIIGLLNARRVRRMSDYVKLSLAATMLCLRDAGIDEDASAFCESCAAVLGTALGSAIYCDTYYRQIVMEGIPAANPMLFAEGVPNAAAAHLSLMLALKGPCQTIIGSRTAGLDALRLAAARIAAGEWERALVGAAEEYSPLVNAAYQQHGLYGPRGFVTGAGAVTLLLESRTSLGTRPRGRARGRMIGGASTMASAGARQMAGAVRRLLDQIACPPALLISANGTWIDRVEAAGTRAVNPHSIGSIYEKLAECFSALPLAGAAAILLTGRLPRGGVLSGDPVGRFGVLATDYSGAASAAALETIA